MRLRQLLGGIPICCLRGMMSVAIVGVVFGGPVARAQQAVPVPAAIVGVVVDTAGSPIGDVELITGAGRRSTVSARDGSFRLADLLPGRYAVVARKVGYLPRTLNVFAGKDDVPVRFVLTPFARSLPPSLTVAVRVGLEGVVADSSHRPLPNVAVEIIGSNRRVSTDAAGAFFVDLDPGSYMVRFGRDGYADQMVSVRVAPDSGRCLA
ncbi:MAG: carboxypeptidase-like regulatory domain-containing protein, partial [Gemmatimonadota bacterium]|nr:carboxypeptidase-like regulatory domain-containing protein [Gemmatimonadota bacterium]